MKTIKFRSNLAAGIVSTIFGIAVCILTPMQISIGFTESVGITPRTFPYVLGGVCALFGILLIIQSLVFKKDTVKELHLGKELTALAYMAVLILYAILFQYSFIAATLILGAATLLFLRCKKPLYYVIVLAMVVLLYLALTQVLHIRLP